MSARTFNRVELMGFVTREPKYLKFEKYTLLIFRVMTIDTYKDPETEQWMEVQQWHSIKAWNKLADTYAQFLKKGTKVWVQAELRSSVHKAKDDKTFYTVNEVHLRDLIILRQPT